MQHIAPFDRNQLSFGSLEEQISPNDPVRFLDAFVEKLNLVKLGFAVKEIQVEGRPSFQSKLFLKIYLYGYLNHCFVLLCFKSLPIISCIFNGIS